MGFNPRETTGHRVNNCAALSTPSVLHVAPSKGGVATAARRLNLGLTSLGVASWVLTADALPNRFAATSYLPSWLAALRILDHALIKIAKRLRIPGWLNLSSRFWRFDGIDIVHFHYESYWYSLSLLGGLGHGRHIVWTMHDKHLGTGECGYPEMWGDCQRWRIGCGACPKASHKGWTVDPTRLVYWRKRRLLRGAPLAVVAPSKYMMTFIESNPIFSSVKKVLIPYGVDTKVFQPVATTPWSNQSSASSRCFVLGLVASRLSEPRKGIHLMPQILRGLRVGLAEREAVLILVGSDLGTEFMRSVSPFCKCRYVGEVCEESKLAEIYSACDVTVVPSLIDNFPSVVLESLACGTPVAAFRVGGLPDMVAPGRTGFLANPDDAFGLGYLIGKTAAIPGRIDAMRRECRNVAVDRYDLRIQAERYLVLYRSLGGSSTR